MMPYFFCILIQQFSRSDTVLVPKVVTRFHRNNVHVHVKNDLSSVFAVVLHYPYGVVACCVFNGMRYPLNNP
jgi:hypothetical protein